MAAALFPLHQFFDNSGDPLSGGKVYTYEPGSTTLKTAYTDADLSVAHANPVVLDAYGRPSSPIWCDGETKLVVKTSADVQLNPVFDNFNKATSGLGSWSTKNSGVLAKSANYDVTTADNGKMVVATSGSWTLGTASAAATMGDGFAFEFKNVGTGIVTFNPNGAETVNGQTSITFGPGDGAVIRCDGSNWRAIDPRFSLIKSGSVSAAATLDLTGLTTQFEAYLLVFHDLLPATDNVEFWARVSDDDGATYEADASDYRYSSQGFSVGGAVAGTGSNGDTKVVLTTGVGNDGPAGEEVRGFVMIHGPADSGDQTAFTWSLSYLNQSGNYTTRQGGGHLALSVATTAIRFMFSSGNIATMTYALYGLRNS